MHTVKFPNWIGEFGWEVMTFQARCRLVAEGYDKAIVSSFPGMEALYEDFAEFVPHSHPGRALGWPDKQYRVKGKWIRYGKKKPTHIRYLLHARGVKRGCAKNYRHWDELSLPNSASIGTWEDYHVPGSMDLRGIPLQELMDAMASVEWVVGGSSGPMHLACLCGPKVLVWGDATHTYLHDPLENRYKETWNPLGADVTFIHAKDWQPEPDEILRCL